MEIQFISHASVIIRSSGIAIWTDPWVTGKAFNNSWSLLGEPYYSEAMLQDIDYIWISHEHPDHFNFPTFELFPTEFKSRITVLFQTQNSDRVFDELRRFGFTHFRALPNRERVYLADGLFVYCYQAHLGDSCLGISDGESRILDINDAELSDAEARKIRREMGGSIDVLLNQFSLAGYHGHYDFERYLPVYAKEKLHKLLRNHRALGAQVTIPFASYVYFSCQDNKYMNRYVNRPSKVADFARSNGMECLFLSEGQTYRLREGTADNSGLETWEKRFDDIENLEFSTPEVVPLEEIEVKARNFSNAIKARYPRILLDFLKPLVFYIEDLELSWRFDLKRGQCEVVGMDREDADALVYSQPLHYAFTHPWGLETLTVSARVLVRRNYKAFKLMKNISILYYNEIYLKPKYFLRKRNLHYMQDRLSSGLLQQVVRKSLRNRRMRSVR